MKCLSPGSVSGCKGEVTLLLKQRQCATNVKHLMIHLLGLASGDYKSSCLHAVFVEIVFEMCVTNAAGVKSMRVVTITSLSLLKLSY